jgi:uncharacterized protein YlzI (FlbEa/FlbD family)
MAGRKPEVRRQAVYGPFPETVRPVARGQVIVVEENYGQRNQRIIGRKNRIRSLR